MRSDNHRIIVIDDNQDIFRDFQTILVDTADTSELDALAADYFGEQVEDAKLKNTHELEYASQGQEGVEKIHKALLDNRPFALAFVDMRMPPGWDGLETIEHLWKVDPNVQVVICTAYSDYSWEEVTKRIGKTDQMLILKKPFDNAEVAQLASALTEKWFLSKQASLKMNEIEQIVQYRTVELAETNEKLQKEIVERKKIEETLRDTNKALEKYLRTLKSTQTQLVQSEKMAALGNLVAGVAHEINTPLGVGITAASFLEVQTKAFAKKLVSGNLKRSELEKYIGTAVESSAMILNNLNRAAELIKSFKQVAVDQTSGERRQFNLKEYINKLLFSLRPNFKRTKHTVSLNCADDIEINSYPGIFSQIITNLVMNSLTHGFENIEAGVITIDFWKDGELLVLCYTDNGKGMNAETLERVFDPFFTTNRAHGGTGLGMHILYNLVTQTLKGQMECTSTPGNGVVFLIRIPLQSIP